MNTVSTTFFLILGSMFLAASQIDLPQLKPFAIAFTSLGGVLLTLAKTHDIMPTWMPGSTKVQAQAAAVEQAKKDA